MPNVFTYECGCGGVVSLDGSGMWAGWGGGLRSHAWAHELGSHEPTGLTLGAREVSVAVQATRSAIDAALTAFARDVAMATPGTVVAAGMRQRAYVLGSTMSEGYHDACEVDLTVVLLDGFWWREVTRRLEPASASIDVGGVGPAPCRVSFVGPCTSPYVTIGSNRYALGVTVPEGSVATLDGIPHRPMATMRDDLGNLVDVFPYAMRDGGAGGGSYAFEPLPVGAHQADWAGTYEVEVTWREWEVEPPWSL